MDGIGNRLVEWYMQNHRQLPWRQTSDPYLIWLSEIILQQTQVVSGLGYYHRIAARFPSVSQLANAPIDELLLLWQGLGYYSRARNMHVAAKQVMERFGGVFPQSYSDILSLKGVGPYTAAAIASIAYGLPHAVVDGNVFRVLARLFAIDTPIDSAEGKKIFDSLANELLNRQEPALHNQAMMELGALVCKPSSPLCGSCPFLESCMAYELQRVSDFPVKAKKTQTKVRYLYYYLCEDGTHLFTRKRLGNDIWKGLYELPLVELPHEMSDEEVLAAATGIVGMPAPAGLLSIEKTRHLLTHRQLHISFVHFRTVQLSPSTHFKLTKIDDWTLLAFPKPIVAYLARVFPVDKS